MRQTLGSVSTSRPSFRVVDVILGKIGHLTTRNGSERMSGGVGPGQSRTKKPSGSRWPKLLWPGPGFHPDDSLPLYGSE